VSTASPSPRAISDQLTSSFVATFDDVVVDVVPLPQTNAPVENLAPSGTLMTSQPSPLALPATANVPR